MKTHQELYTSLMNLASNSEAFYFVDSIVSGRNYRIFNYRLASYTDFLQEDALEARGITFEVNGDVATLVSLPMIKYWNLWENPHTLDIKSTDEVLFSMNKLDGSLISTVQINENEFTVKSKTSFQSGQALMAEDIIRDDFTLHELLSFLNAQNYTVNMELTSPLNRIVLPYQKSALTILNVRDLNTGVVYYPELIKALFNVPDRYLVDYYDGFPHTDDFQHYIDNVSQVEGLVCVTKDGRMFKIKTAWYCALHHTKDSVTIPRRLYEACLAGASDDLLAMFHDDPVACKMINTMQTLAFDHYNHVVSTVEAYYNENKDLDRKSFAIKAQNDSEIQKAGVFSLAMNLYTGRLNDYAAFLVKNNEKVLAQYEKQLGSLLTTSIDE